MRGGVAGLFIFMSAISCGAATKPDAVLVLFREPLRIASLKDSRGFADVNVGSTNCRIYNQTQRDLLIKKGRASVMRADSTTNQLSWTNDIDLSVSCSGFYSDDGPDPLKKIDPRLRGAVDILPLSHL